MQVLLNTSNTKAVMFDKQTDIVFLSFTSLLGDDFDPNDDEQTFMDFKSLSSSYTTIYITDKTMSWANNVEWELLAKTIKPYIDNKYVVAIGLSMGAFNAIISSNFININRVVAFNPQYTINTRIFPKTGYAQWAKKIRRWRFPTVLYGFKKHTEYIVVVGEIDIGDTMFLHKFPKSVNIVNFGEHYGHNLPKDLKDRGVLQSFLSLVADQDISEIYKFRDLHSTY
jgi:hypothetical protein